MNQRNEEVPDFHPLHILDNLLLSFEKGFSSTNTQRLVQISEFLFGSQSKKSSLLESSLEILDQSAEHDLIHLAPVRLLIEKQSKRSVFIVRGSRPNRRNTSLSNVPEYICTMGIGSGRCKKIAAGNISYHCSCRSFYERSKVDRLALCKHLLAVRLAPFLNTGDGRLIYAEQEVDAEEWIRIYTHVSMEAL
jgi:hypothetical protein